MERLREKRPVSLHTADTFSARVCRSASGTRHGRRNRRQSRPVSGEPHGVTGRHAAARLSFLSSTRCSKLHHHFVPVPVRSKIHFPGILPPLERERFYYLSRKADPDRLVPHRQYRPHFSG